MFGRATIRLGIGPHSSCLYIYTLLGYKRILQKCCWGPGKVLKFFISKRVGALILCRVRHEAFTEST